MAVVSKDTFEVEIVGAEKVARGYKDIESAQKGAAAETRNVDKAQRDAGDGMSRLAGRAVALVSGVAAATAALQAMRAGLDKVREGVGLAIDFEQDFAKIRTLTDAAGKDLERQLLDLAARVPQTAGDITAAAYQAISGGIDPTQVTEFLDAASKTAVAGSSSLTESVDLLTTAVNAYKDSGLSAAEASDALFATVRVARTTIPELTSALGRAAPAAAQFGVRLDELGAATSVLTKSGLSTAEAMTVINGLVKAVVSPTQQAKEKLDALGVAYGASRVQAVGLAGVLRDINEATGGNIDQVSTLFRRYEATQGLVTLLSGNMRTFEADLKSVGGAAGETARANDIMFNTIQGGLDLLGAQGENVLREIGQQLLPLVRDEVRFLSEVIEKNGPRMVATFSKLVEVLIKLAKAMGPVIDVGLEMLDVLVDPGGGMAHAVEVVTNHYDDMTRAAGESASVLAQASLVIRDSVRNVERLDPFVERLKEMAPAAKAAAIEINKLFGFVRNEPTTPARLPTLPTAPRRAARSAPARPDPNAVGGADFERAMADRALDAARRNAEARAQLVEGETDRRLALLEVRHQRELQAAADAGADITLLERVHAQQRAAIVDEASQAAMDRRFAAAQVDAERRAMLIEDQLTRELTLLELRHQRELDLARERGENITLLHEQHTRERTRITSEAIERQRELNRIALSESLGAADAILKGLGKLGKGSRRLDGIIAGARSAVAAVDAINFYGEAIAQFASQNYAAGIKFTAAAVTKTVAAVEYAKVAAQLGASGGGARGAAGGGGAAAAAGSNQANVGRPGRRELAGDQSRREERREFHFNFGGHSLVDEQTLVTVVGDAFRRVQGVEGVRRGLGAA